MNKTLQGNNGMNKSMDKELEASLKKAAATFDKKSLRKIWSKVKQKALEDLEKKNPKSHQTLEKAFKKDLGSLLDKFDAECAKAPEHRMDKLEKYHGACEDVIADYHTDIKISALDGNAKGQLTGILDEILEEQKKRIKFFKSAAKGTILKRL